MVIISNDGNIKAIRLLETRTLRYWMKLLSSRYDKLHPFGKFTEDISDIVELRLIRMYRYSDTVESNVLRLTYTSTKNKFT